MKAVSGILELHKTLNRLPQIPLGLSLQDLTVKGQIQGMFYEFDFRNQATFREFEGKTSA